MKIENTDIHDSLGLIKSSKCFYLIIKRFFDIIISILSTVPLLLLSLIIKIAYTLNGDNDPIIYKQPRVGLNGKSFIMYKFRTMSTDAEKELEKLLLDTENKKEWNENHKLQNDPRITSVGHFLRETSLDEAPQFINVLKGDMSLVGPRPLVKGELKIHNGSSLYEAVRPGITGWWACNGRSDVSYRKRLELEYYYVKNCSLSLDILIIFKTLFCVVQKTGAR